MNVVTTRTISAELMEVLAERLGGDHSYNRIARHAQIWWPNDMRHGSGYPKIVLHEIVEALAVVFEAGELAAVKGPQGKVGTDNLNRAELFEVVRDAACEPHWVMRIGEDGWWLTDDPENHVRDALDVGLGFVVLPVHWGCA